MVKIDTESFTDDGTLFDFALYLIDFVNTSIVFFNYDKHFWYFSQR